VLAGASPNEGDPDEYGGIRNPTIPDDPMNDLTHSDDVTNPKRREALVKPNKFLSGARILIGEDQS